ncbi:MAG: tRNA (adenosine(37)-N6)-threonylcarbamoyltransferase complex ATPase subunit type 1 TsaE [Sphingomonadales bacterium]
MTDQILSFEDLNEEELSRLGHLLAPLLKAGDFIGLTGKLGAGKSVFARSLIRTAMGEADLDVPSPTYNLIQPYQPHDPYPEILHVDLYRVEATDEIRELGLEDAHTSILLVEWPERLGEALPGYGLIISLQEGSKATLRNASVLGDKTWDKRLKNLNLIRV